MDRLDLWLNGQVGWRRVAVTWLNFWPLAVGLGSLDRTFHAWRHPGCQQIAAERFIQECEPQLGAGFLVVAVLSVLAALPLAWLLAAWQVWRAAPEAWQTILFLVQGCLCVVPERICTAEYDH